ncbi:MAG TPA: hypothetical protein VG188_07725 [Solirubrobacteraceae bacterium]|jgi:hypothetical protein|nr:hypothetical protein [Solirubrobacteraceae bacterium]
MTERRPPTESELVELVRSSDARAPESLHRKIDAMIASRPSRSSRSSRAPLGQRGAADSRGFSLRPRLAGVGAIAAALIALAVAVGLSGGSSTLSVRDAAALTTRPATHAAPAENPSDRAELAVSVDGVSFPYWGGHFGWRSTGTRTDSVDGRSVTTTFYASGHRRVGYAIVAGTAPSQGSGGVVSQHDGTSYRLLTYNGAPVVTWLREGHLCVVSGRGVDGATLLRLAGWDERRSISS